ncbi:MAG: hypothetical protein WCG97_00405 [bacterium]
MNTGAKKHPVMKIAKMPIPISIRLPGWLSWESPDSYSEKNIKVLNAT